MSPGSGLRRLGARALVSAFLILAVATGGASLEGEFSQALGFAASAFVLSAIFATGTGWVAGPVRTVLAFAVCLTALAAAQLFPLPLGLVEVLPDRATAISGLSALGHAPADAPLSLSPERTAGAFLAFLTPLAAFCLVAALKWSRGAAMLGWTVPLLGAASALLGLAQVFFGNAPRLYLYEFTSEGLPAGFFSNVNHQASFLLMCLPFVAARAGDLRRDWDFGDHQVALAILLAACFLLLVTGILGAGSVAGYILLVPVLLLSMMLLGGARRGAGGPWLGVGLGVAITLFAGAFVFSSPVLEGLGVTSLEESDLSRQGIAWTSLEILERHWQAGTGLGSFDQVYHLYEDPLAVVNVYVAHVHNDYLEWLIETGVAGALLLAVFLAWWLFAFVRLWTSTRTGAPGLRRAASVACLVIVLHSFVDYPLRTPAIAAFGAMCLALMVVPRARRDGPPEPAAAGTAEPLRIVTL